MPEYDPVAKISIVPRGAAGGLTFFAPSEERLESGLYSRQYLENQVGVGWGGQGDRRGLWCCVTCILYPMGEAFSVDHACWSSTQRSAPPTWCSLPSPPLQMAVALGGRVAEEVIFGPDDVTTGASNDFMQVGAGRLVGLAAFVAAWQPCAWCPAWGP